MKNTFTDLFIRKQTLFTRNQIKALVMRTSQVYLLIMVSAMITMAAPNGKGQSIETTTVELKILNKPLKQAFREIERQTEFLFQWSADLEKTFPRVNLLEGKYTVKEALDLLLKDTGLEYVQNVNHIGIRVSNDEDLGPRKASEKKIDQPEARSVALVIGTVKDAANQEPLAGVNIIVKGTTKGTTTDVEGKFGIDAEDDDVLVFSFIGFQAFETGVGGRTVIDVSMEVDVKSLKEVEVNAGYWNVKDKERTGNISKVTAEQIQTQPVSNPLQALQGRVPGLYINQFSGIPGSNFQVRIRGTNSIRNGNNPLFIIDGVPFNSETLSDVNATGALYGQQGVSPLYSMNPNDIESIEILKDADATAIYGSRGSNGVILITTKKGKVGKPRFEINVMSGTSMVTNKLDLLNTQQYLAMRNEATVNDGLATPAVFEHDINGAWDQNRYTDWQEELIGRPAGMLVLNSSLSGGNNETQFLLSGGYENQNTVFPGTNSAQKFSTHFSLGHTSTDKRFNARLTNSYVVANNNILSGDLTGQAIQLPPNAPALYDANGDINWENSTWTNPLAYLNGRFNSNTYNLITNVELGYEVVRGLRIKTAIGLNDFRTEEKRKEPSTVYPPAFGVTPASSTLTIGNGNNRSLIIEPQANWEVQVAKGILSVVVGGTLQKQERENKREIFRGFSSNALMDDPRSASTVRLDAFSNSEYKYNAIYGRVNYNWDSKYLLNVTGRRDGSSRFGPGRQFANFGAVGFAWIFSNEGFATNIPVVSFGKIRGSLGTTGNDQIGDYQFLDTFISSSSYQGVAGLIPARLFNPDYGWETNKKIEGAIELGFLKDRILLQTSYYRNRSSDQLVDYTLASTTGFLSVNRNLPATVQNSGFEFELSTTNLNKGSFKWTTSVNLTAPRNKLVSFPNIESSSYANTYEVGKSLNVQKRYHFLGLNPETGIFQFEDINGDGAITFADRIYSVELAQKYYGGITNSFSYKGLEVTVFLQFVQQERDRYTAFNMPGALKLNQPLNVLDARWISPGDITTAQLFTRVNSAASTAYSQYRSSDGVIEDASFIRLKNVSISYQFPERLLGPIKGRLYIQGQNLLTFSKYDGLDPETGSSFLPPLTSFAAGMQLTF